jgi:hypothetical protein
MMSFWWSGFIATGCADIPHKRHCEHSLPRNTHCDLVNRTALISCVSYTCEEWLPLSSLDVSNTFTTQATFKLNEAKNTHLCLVVRALLLSQYIPSDYAHIPSPASCNILTPLQHPHILLQVLNHPLLPLLPLLTQTTFFSKRPPSLSNATKTW